MFFGLDLTTFIAKWGYWAVFLGSLIEGETIILTASALAAAGYLSITKIALLSFVGTVVADQGLFFLGYGFGKPFLDMLQRMFPKVEPYLKKGFAFLEKYQTTYILIFRFIYGIRIVSPIIIGAQKIALSKFAMLNIVAAVIWVVISCALGYFLGEVIIRIIEQYGYIVLTLVGVILAGLYMGRKYMKQREEKKGS